MAQLTFQLSEDSRLLIQHLESAKVGDFFSYADLSKVIGKDIQRHRGPLTTARNDLQRDRGAVSA